MFILLDGKELKGTCMEIVEAIKNESFDPNQFEDMDEYMEELQKRIWRLSGTGVDIKGDTTAERAESLINELTRIGYIELKEE